MGCLKTDFLFSKMSLLTGAASAFNLAGNFYRFNHSATEAEADAKAIFSDWSMVGEDLRTAFKEFEVERKKQLELNLGL
jgi:hypothetical protein